MLSLHCEDTLEYSRGSIAIKCKIYRRVGEDLFRQAKSWDKKTFSICLHSSPAPPQQKTLRVSSIIFHSEWGRRRVGFDKKNQDWWRDKKNQLTLPFYTAAGSIWKDEFHESAYSNQQKMYKWYFRERIHLCFVIFCQANKSFAIFRYFFKQPLQQWLFSLWQCQVFAE